MRWKDLRIGTKLALGFGCMLLLILLGGGIGYSGLQNVYRALVTISDQEAPVVDTSMEMKIALMKAMSAMDAYQSATAVMATMDESKLADLEEEYRQATGLFDEGVKAILDGGSMGEVRVIKTSSSELADVVRKAAEVHDAKYDPTAAELMQNGRQLLAAKAEELAAMAALEKTVREISGDSAAVETTIGNMLRKHATDGNIGTVAQTILREEVPLADAAMELKYVITMSRILMEEYVQESDPALLDGLDARFKELVDQFDRLAGAVLQGGELDGQTVVAAKDAQLRQMVEELAGNHAIFENNARQMMQAHRDILAHTATVGQTMAKLDQAGEEAVLALSRVEEMAGKNMDAAKTAGHASSDSAISLQLLVMACSVVIGGLLGFATTRSITRPLKLVGSMLTRLGAGDIANRLNMVRQDELGQMARELDGFADNLQSEVVEAFERISHGDLTFKAHGVIKEPLAKANAALNQVMKQIMATGDQIAAGSSQAAESSETLSQGATESAASLEQISASMNEMADQTKRNADNAIQTETLANHAKTAAEKGNAHMQTMIGAMDEINAAGQNIGKIIKTIDEIAFQTNLLALNAAVEAARAGQHGKGFAVVAEEVRNLAARSARAASETAELIESTVEKTERGTLVAGQTADALREIVTEIGRVSDLAAEIAASSNEQAQGIAQINQGLTQIDSVTQQNTAHAEETASIAEQLASEGEQLHQMLQRFSLCPSVLGDAAQAQPREEIGQIRWTQPPQKRPAAKPAPQPASAWGEIQEGARMQIALDDEEFGKY